MWDGSLRPSRNGFHGVKHAGMVDIQNTLWSGLGKRFVLNSNAFDPTLHSMYRNERSY